MENEEEIPDEELGDENLVSVVMGELPKELLEAFRKRDFVDRIKSLKNLQQVETVRIREYEDLERTVNFSLSHNVA